VGAIRQNGRVVAETESANPPTRNGSALAILVSNAITMAFAYHQRWDLRPLLLIYWCQSVIIGAFNFMRMMRLRRFSTAGFTSNGRPVPETSQGKRGAAIFFAVHFGFFHVGYMVFLVALADGELAPGDVGGPWRPDRLDRALLVFSVISFLVGHWFSYRRNVEADLAGRPNLGTLMFLPYARILPMHLTIILAFWMGSQRGALMLFMALKTVADLIMHHVEHRVMRRAAA